MAATFTTKVNQRQVGLELSILAEPHTVPLVPPFSVKLIEVPLQVFPSTVAIPGFTETLSPSPSIGQFVVDYNIGFITFHFGAAGSVVAVDYEGRGSIVDAIDVNNIQTVLDAVCTEVVAARGNKASLDERLDISLDDDGLLNAEVVVPSTISTTITDDFTFPNDVTINGALTVLGGTIVAILTSDPGSPSTGEIWFNSTDGQFKGYNGTNVVLLG